MKVFRCNNRPIIILALVAASCVLFGGHTLHAFAQAIQSNSSIPDIPLQIPLPKPGSISVEGSALTVTGIADYLVRIYVWLLRATAILSVLVFVWAGFLWMTAGGEQKNIKKAKDLVSSNLIGVGLLLGSYLLLYTISPNLVGLKPALDVGSIYPIALDLQTILRTNMGPVSTSGTEAIPNENGYVRGPANGNYSQYDALIKKASDATKMNDCTLLEAFMYTESGAQPGACSGVGACGLVQLMPDTARQVGLSPQDRLDPEKNLLGAAKYLRWLKEKGCNNASSNEVCNTSQLKYIAAAYNAGPGRNNKASCGKTTWECSPGAYAETHEYWKRVTATYNYLKSSNKGC